MDEPQAGAMAERIIRVLHTTLYAQSNKGSERVNMSHGEK